MAALAFGAGPIRPVDKIVGPGNAYVTAAKRRVYGVVEWVGDVGLEIPAGDGTVLGPVLNDFVGHQTRVN